MTRARPTASGRARRAKLRRRVAREELPAIRAALAAHYAAKLAPRPGRFARAVRAVLAFVRARFRRR